MGLLLRFGGWLVAGLSGLLGASALPIAKKVLVGLGFGYLVFQGVDILLSSAYSAIQVHLNQLPPILLGLVNYLEVDRMISVLISAYTTKAAIQTSLMGGLTRTS
jgi:hypothetical protein